MKKIYFLLLLLVFPAFSFSQMYILNEDFSGTSGTVPPSGWSNTMISGVPTDLWHFDNPGLQSVNFPITEPFAIFDAAAVSGNGTPESATLESPAFDASVSNFILLNFQHTFTEGPGATAKVEAFNGNTWQEIASYNTSTLNPASEILDLSSAIGGVTNAKIRFTWSGNGSGWWAVDNIRIYASLPLDAGIVSLDNPLNPVSPGIQNVAVSLCNFGYNTLNSTTINWTVNGVAQTPYTWGGNIGFGQTLSNIVIGSYNFQDPVRVKIWQSNPNGQADPNPYNDTILVYVMTTLCGTYTVGGTNPDFTSFTDIASVLSTAGITCPVTFLVRDGVYREQFILRSIPGSSASNTVTFRSESGDSTAAILKISPSALKYEPMIWMEGTKHVIFEKLGLFTGSDVSYSNDAILMEAAQDIIVRNCYFEGWNQFDFGILAQLGSRQIDIGNNRFRSVSGRAGAVHTTGEGTREINFHDNIIIGAFDLGYHTIRIGTSSSNIIIDNNQVEGCYSAVYIDGADSVSVTGNIITNSNYGISLDNNASYVGISSNRLTGIKSHTSVADGTVAIWLNEAAQVNVYNNFIQTTGLGPVHGINFSKSNNSSACFNSVNITNNDEQKKSKGLYLSESSNITALDNIFEVTYVGTPVYIAQPSSGLNFNKNDYHNLNGPLGFYNGTAYVTLQQWQVATGLDAASLSVQPFFTSTTDLSINQVLLNNAGVPVAGIDTDIDGTARNPVTPDIGAKEYTPCSVDAGVNAFSSPQNPLPVGTSPVKVILQNQGQTALSSVRINWLVNGLAQAQYTWSGNLAGGANIEVQIGTYDFQAGQVFLLKAWTSEPNNGSDCDHANDSISSQGLAVPLCGSYTIGGISPDFATISDAVDILNLAGVSCPVTFMIRDGLYEEQFTIEQVPGSSAANTVTFRSESLDSTLATIKISPDAQKYTNVITLNGSSYIRFDHLGILTGAMVAIDNNALLMSKVANVEVSNCYLDLTKELDQGIGIIGQSDGVVIRDCRFECTHPRSMAIGIYDAGTRNVTITGNIINGSTDNGYQTVRIGTDTRRVQVSGNYISRCFQAVLAVGADSLSITSNIIENSNFGIVIDNFCSVVQVSGNRLLGISSNQDIEEGTAGLVVKNSSLISIFNNFIQTGGSGICNGITLLNPTTSQLNFNSFNITNTDAEGKSTGLSLTGNSSQANARNNIFSIKYDGIPVSIDTKSDAISFDNNDYYSSDQVIGYYNGNRYTDLQTWTDSTAMDQNSFAILPFYTSDTDLSINQVLLNNSGTPISGISQDIDGSPRDPANPDIGAKEYSPCSTDAGITAVTAPVNPLPVATLPVKVLLQNQGTTNLSSVKINWQVNGESQAAFSWTGNLPVKGMAEVEIGSYDFTSGKIYLIKSWTSEPNGASDCNSKNDACYSRNLATKLCGIYTIGGNEPDFGSFSEAVTVLNDAGVECAVEFLVRDGIYYDSFTLGNIDGSSETNTVTFRSESGDSTLAVLHIPLEATGGQPLMHLEGASNVKFYKLGLATGASNANNAVQVEICSGITVQNCYITASNASDIGVLIAESSTDIEVLGCRIECPHAQASAVSIDGAGTGNITISHNSMTGSPMRGNALLRVSNNVKKVSISNNRIRNSYRAVSISTCDSVVVSGNSIDNTNEGILADGSSSSISITANRVTNVLSHQNFPEGTSGISVKNVVSVDIINNFVETEGNGPCIGISVQQTDSCRVIYNSVNVTNSDAQNKSKGIYLLQVHQVTSKDNICNILTNGVPCHIGTNVTGLLSDYNNYYHPTGIIGKIENTTYTSLYEWGLALNGDANAKNVNPYFAADTIPLPFQRALNGAGIPIPGITTDIDGKIRFNQAPDIGCLEFKVDYGIMDLLSPDLNCFHDGTDSVTVYIKMYGDVPFSELRVAYRLDNGPEHIDTIPGPVYGDIIHTFNTVENISAEGDYLFHIWLINTLDDNINNDTLNAWRYSKPSPVVSMDWDNFCTGWTVNFSGSATVAAPYSIVSYEWLFGDGDTATQQNPVHTFLQPGTYSVTLRAYSSAGCFGYLTEDVYIDPNFQGLSMTYDLVNEACYRSYTGSLGITTAGGYPPYSIYINDEKITENPVTGLTSGTYVVRVEDSEQCSVTDTIESMATVFLNPQIQADPLSGMTPLTVQFGFTANDPISWAWFFPDADVIETDTTMAPSYTFYSYGTHDVVLEVQGGHPYYCVERDTVQIFVDIIVTIDVNTVFTPNGDGNNDYFEIKTTAVKDLKANIYSQWGNKVFEIDTVNGRWDGNTKGGAECPDGTYFYEIKATGFDYKDYERSGAVLLLRHAAQAFPNPASREVRIEPYGPLDPPASFIVYSAMGEEAMTGAINDPGLVQIDLSRLAKGMYLIKVFDRSRHYYVRVIKN